MIISCFRRCPTRRSCFRSLVAAQIRCSSTFRPKENARPFPDRLIYNVLNKRFPKVYDYYIQLKQGFTDLLNDGKQIYRIQQKVNDGDPRKLRNLTLEELDLYYDCWYHIKGLIPIIVLGILPFGNAVVFVLLYWKPLKFLSPHFWSENQKRKHNLDTHMKRIVAYRPIVAHLKYGFNHSMYRKHYLFTPWNQILLLLQTDRIPTVLDVLRCSDLFKHHEIYSLSKLSSAHVNELAAVHNIRGIFSKHRKLQEWAEYLSYVDLKIRNMGGPSNLPEVKLRKYCFQRGLNAYQMSTNDMRKWLDEYLKFSSEVTQLNFSMLLHAPVIFGLNHPSNRSLSIDS